MVMSLSTELSLYTGVWHLLTFTHRPGMSRAPSGGGRLPDSEDTLPMGRCSIWADGGRWGRCSIYRNPEQFRVILQICGLYCSVHDHFGTGVDDFGTVQFRYTSYMPNQPVPLRYKRVDHFGTVFGPFGYIMKSDCKKTLNGILYER